MRRYLLVLGMVLLVGCGKGDGPELGTVHGRVTLDGSPLAKATVTFTPTGPDGGRPSSAVTDDDGNYEIQYTHQDFGAPPGPYRVEITTATTKTDGQGNDVDVPEKLPAKYNVESELNREVKPGDNNFDFALDSKGKVAGPDDKPRRNETSPDCY